MSGLIDRCVVVRRNQAYDQFAPLGLRDLIAACFRYWPSILALTFLIFAMSIVVILLLPAKFDSQGQLLVRLGRGSVALDPTTSLTPTVSLQESRASQVNSVREMLRSRALAERVVHEIGAQRIMEPHSRLSRWIHSVMESVAASLPKSPPSGDGEMTEQQVAAQLEMEQACKTLESMLDVYSAPDVYTVNLGVRSESPFLSRDVLNAVMQQYQAYHVEAHQSDGSVEFFDQESKQAFALAADAKKRLAETKTEMGVVEIEAAKSSLVGLISQVDRDLLSTESEIASVRSELEQLDQEIAVLPAEIESETISGIPKATGDSMRQTLYGLEVEYKELTSKLKSNHPKLRALKEQLDSATEIAASEVGERPQTRVALNPIRQQLELTKRTTTSRLSGLQSKKKTLLESKQQLKQQLATLNEDEAALAKLSWEASLAEADYMRAAENRDRARRVAELDREKVSEISIIQPATLSLKKASPSRGVLVVLAAMMSMGLAVGQAVLRGLFDVSGEVDSNNAVGRGDSSGRRDVAIEEHLDDSIHEPMRDGTEVHDRTGDIVNAESKDDQVVGLPR
ncbi:GumC family protein [Crateriforma spongiae]|uniref:GumC family protein n=1 Tax=Crateriforma spongiae TaxID=2724528 RepID=UPI001445BB39|nr:exopolysaccharide biosynthesis protein [Crateriforma spongiae]